MDEQTQNSQNRRKIAELDVAVFGSEEQQIPGLITEFKAFRLIMNGDGSAPGVMQKVGIMWRVHVWLLMGLSGVAGSFLTLLVQRFITHA